MRWLTAFAFLLSGCIAAAEEPRPPRVDARKAYFAASAGWMRTDGVGNESGSGPVLSVAGGYRRHHHLALDVEVGFQILDFPAPDGAPATFFASTDLDLTSATAALVAKGLYPMGPFVPYVGAGVGLTFARLELTGSSFGIPGGTFDEERDFTTALTALVGFDVEAGEASRVGIEYRWLDSEASFGELSGGKIEIGGEALTLTYRLRFR